LAIAMAAAFGVGVVVLLFLLFQLLLGGSESGSVELTAPTQGRAPAPGITIPPNARTFNSLAELERGGRPPAGQPFALLLSENELNDRLRTELAKRPESIFRNMTAKVVDDRVEFTGTVRAAGMELNTTFGVKLAAVNGRLTHEIASVNFGPIPVPAVARQAIGDAIDREIQSQKLFDSMQFDQLAIRNGQIQMVARTR
jgi:hypothetical protein